MRRRNIVKSLVAGAFAPTILPSRSHSFFQLPFLSSSGVRAELPLQENLVMHLDASNVDSYSGSGNTWANLVETPADGSGKTDYDYQRGNGSTASTFPTFNGTPGTTGAYWSFDGGDYFSPIVSSPEYFDGIGRTDRDTTAIIVCKAGSLSSTQTFMGNRTSGSGAEHGLWFYYNTSGTFLGDNSGQATRTIGGVGTSDLVCGFSMSGTNNQWNVFSNSSSIDTYNPGAWNSTTSKNTNWIIGADGNSTQNFLSGGRVYELIFWNVALSNDDLQAAVNLLTNKWGF
jgi:hypothetical protein